MTAQGYGLLVFLAVFLLDGAGLGLDLVLYTQGWHTITEHVWDRPWLGAPIVALQVAGAVALGVHFWGR